MQIVCPGLPATGPRAALTGDVYRRPSARGPISIAGPGGPRADELAPGSTGQTICMI